jgi:hypothetical protein
MHCIHPVVKSFWDEKADATGAETWFARLVTRRGNADGPTNSWATDFDPLEMAGLTSVP